MPEESAQFADAVVLSEAEDAWPALLADYKRGEWETYNTIVTLIALVTLAAR